MNPISLDDVRRKFDDWREKRNGRGRIPNELWDLLRTACQQLPPSLVAKAARVDYYQLRARVGEANSREEHPAALTVSQIVPVGTSHLPMEIEHPSGFRIRLDPSHPGALAFVRALISGEAPHAQPFARHSRLYRSRRG